MSTKGVYDYDSTQDRLTQIADYSADVIADIVNVYGAKNLLESEAVTQTVNDVTFTVNNDGSIKVNGTASQTTWYSLLRPASQKLGLEGSYIASCCPLGGSESTYYFQIVDRGTDDNTDIKIYKDTGNGVIVPFFSTHYYRIQILIRNGATVNNLTFKPMIRLASIEDNTYVPYAKSNKELTDDKAEKNDLTSINITSGTTNNTGSTIASGTFFYYKGSLVRAKTDIANGATLTQNTNYEAVTAGGLNQLNEDLNTLQNQHVLVAFFPGTFRNKSNERRYIRINTDVAGTIQYYLDDTLTSASLTVGWNVIEVASGKTYRMGSGLSVDHWFGFVDLAYFEQIS